jgi:elongation factor Ts
VAVSIDDIKSLRKMTGAGMMDAKKVLEEANGDMDKAIELMRVKGMAKADKKADRATENGLVEAYVHSGKIGVLVEVACETDFVARTEEFKGFVHDLAIHIAASSPLYLDRAAVPTEVSDKEAELFTKEVTASGKPAEHAVKIVEGKMNKYYAGICLMEQPFVKDPDRSIETLLKELIGKLGENIVVRRYERMELGAE